jgi:hypothetical protein
VKGASSEGVNANEEVITQAPYQQINFSLSSCRRSLHKVFNLLSRKFKNFVIPLRGMRIEVEYHMQTGEIKTNADLNTHPGMNR